jgi:hypothetical protein
MLGNVINRITEYHSIPTEKSFSADCQDLLSKLLVAKEGERIGMQTLMRHPWVNDNCPMLEPYKRPTENFNEMDLDSVALEVSDLCPILTINSSKFADYTLTYSMIIGLEL